MTSRQAKLREYLAELEHEQWVKWSKSIAQAEKLSPDRLLRWQKLWVPYKDLTEKQKDQDREWADKTIALMSSQGCVLESEGGLPHPDVIDGVTANQGGNVVSPTWMMQHSRESVYRIAQDDMIRARFTATVPLEET